MPSKWGARKGGLEGSHTTQVSIPDAPVVGRGGVGANGPRETPGRGRPMPRVWSAPFRHRPEDSLGPWRIVTVAGKWVGVGSGSGMGTDWAWEPGLGGPQNGQGWTIGQGLWRRWK